MGHKFTKFAVERVAPINEGIRRGKISGAEVLGSLGVAGSKKFIRTAKALPARAQKLFKGGCRRRCSRRTGMYGAGGKRGMRWGYKSCSKCHSRHKCVGRHRGGRRYYRRAKSRANRAIRQLATLKRLARR